jgi:hypothetical protein
MPLCLAAPAFAAETPYLYKVTLVQAAPGRLLELIDLYKSRAAELKQAGDETPLWMRHSQGDHWDLMVLFPLGSYSEYYQPECIGKRQKAAQAGKLDDKFKDLIAWQEDLFAYGPPLADLRKAFAAGAFFHVEMFVALPGKFADLYKEREMENAYSKALKEPENFIFVRDQGAAWDIFTIGVFRDLITPKARTPYLKTRKLPPGPQALTHPARSGRICAGLFASTMTHWLWRSSELGLRRRRFW